MKRDRRPRRNSDLVALGVAIQKQRKLLGWSQEEAAEASGIHRTYFADVERGTRNLGFRNLVAIARGMKLSPAELLREFDRK